MAALKTDNKDLTAYLSIYQSYIEYKIHEGDLVWSRFSGFVVTHSIFLAILGQLLVAKNLPPNKTLYFITISTLGLLLGLLWLISTIRGFESVEFWSNASMDFAEKIKSKFKIPNVFKKGREYFKDNREVTFNLGHMQVFIQGCCITQNVKINTRLTAYLSIGIMLLPYILILIALSKGWIK